MGIRGLDAWLTPPPDEEGPCAVCGNGVDYCICPECDECGCYGDPHCYDHHGLVRSAEQVASLAAAEARWQAEAEREAAFAEDSKSAVLAIGEDDCER
jgi:hypothetical protein